MSTQYNLRIVVRGASRRVVVAAALTALLWLPMGLKGKVSASTPDAFCQGSVARDFLKPLDRVPVASGFAADGQLPVGPSNLRLYVRNAGVVPIGKAMFGARGALNSKRASRPLEWWVQSDLERVNDPDHAKVIKRKQQYIQRTAGFAGRQFGFSSTGIPSGFYRLTVEIKNSAERVLGRYQRAFRALPARSDLRLSKGFTSLAPDEGGSLRIENRGTVEAWYGANYRLWNAENEEIPLEPIFGANLYRLEAGQAGQCLTFNLPKDIASGQYRIGALASDRLKRNQLLTTSFVVP